MKKEKLSDYTKKELVEIIEKERTEGLILYITGVILGELLGVLLIIILNK